MPNTELPDFVSSKPAASSELPDFVRPSPVLKQNDTRGMAGSEPPNAVTPSIMGVIEELAARGMTALRDNPRLAEMVGGPVNPFALLRLRDQLKTGQFDPYTPRPVFGADTPQAPVGPMQPGVSVFGETLKTDSPAEQLAKGLTTPGNIAIGALAPVSRPVALLSALGFGAQGVSDVPAATKELFTTGSDKGEAATRLAMDLLMAKGGVEGMKGVRAGVSEPRIGPQETPQGAIRPEGIAEGKTVKAWLQSTAKESPYRPLADKILSVHDKSLDTAEVVLDPSVRSAAYDPKGKKVYVNPAFANNEFAIMNEIAHHVTVDRVMSSRGAEVKQMYETAREQFRKNGVDPDTIHGLSSPEEFVAETLTNKGFQQQMKFMRFGDRSLADRMVDLTLSALGRAREKGSLLAPAKELSERTAMSPMAADIEGTRGRLDVGFDPRAEAATQLERMGREPNKEGTVGLPAPPEISTPMAPRTGPGVAVGNIGMNPYQQPFIEPKIETSIGAGLKEEPSGGEISFRSPASAGAIPSARQQAVESRLQSGLGNAEDLRPAVKVGDKIVVGKVGQTHADIFRENGLDPEAPANVHESANRGFVNVNQPDKWLDRQQAEGVLGRQGTAAAGGVDSMDLPGAVEDRAETQGRNVNADVVRYGRLTKMLREEKDPSRKMQLWGEVEKLKNQYGGKVPGTLESGLGKRREATEVFGKDVRPEVAGRYNSITQPDPSIKPLDTNLSERGPLGKKTSVVQDVKNAVRKTINVATKTDRWILPQDVGYDMLDNGGGKFQGTLFKEIRYPADDLWNKADQRIKATVEPVLSQVQKEKMGFESSERIGVWLALRQEGGRERLQAMGFSPSEIQTFANGITPKELDVAQKMAKVYANLGPELQRVAKTADGVNVKLRENYSPFFRDWKSYRPEADEFTSNPAIPSEGATPEDVLWPGLEAENKSRVVPGSTISRLKGAMTPIRIDAFSTFDRYVRDAVHYIEMRQFLKDTSRIVRTPEFAAKYGDIGQKYVMDSLNNMARQGKYRRIGILDALRKANTYGTIAWRIPSQIVHISNLPLAVKHVGMDNFSRGIEAAVSEEGQDFLQKHFREVLARGGGEQALTELENIPESKAGRALQQVRQKGFAAQRFLDGAIAQSTALGAYIQAVEAKGGTVDFAKPDLDAIRIARVKARRAVASPIYKDTPLVFSRGGSAMRSLMQYQNTFLDQWSNIRYETGQLGIAQALKGNPWQLMGFTLAMVGVLGIESSIKWGYKALQSKLADRKMKETYAEEFLHEAGRRIPGVGQATSRLKWGESGIPSVDTVFDFLKSAGKSTLSDDKRERQQEGLKAIGEGLAAVGFPGSVQATDIAKSLQSRYQFPRHERMIKSESGRKIETMSLPERAKAESKHKEVREPMTEVQRANAAGRAVEAIAKRGSEVLEGMSKADKQWLKTRNVALPGFDNKLNVNGQKVYLTDEETDRLKEMVQKEYEKVMPEIRRRFDGMSKDVRDDFVKERFNEAREKARQQISNFIQSRSKLERNQQKRKTIFTP